MASHAEARSTHSAHSVHSAPSIHAEPAEQTSSPYSLARAVHARRSEYVRPHKIRIKVGSWNVAACPGTDKDLAAWFVEGKGIDEKLGGLRLSSDNPGQGQQQQQGHDHSSRLPTGDEVGLYVLGLQEIVDLNTTKDFVNRAVYTDTSAMDRWKAAAEAAMPAGYELITAEQMTGLLLLIYASPEVAATISNVSTKQVGTGLLNYFGNKGAVTTRLLFGDTTRMVFVNCHLASGAASQNLERRIWDVEQIHSKTQFDPIVRAGVEEDEDDTIGNADFAFWFGDLNFRLVGLPGDDIRRLLTLHARGEYASSEDKPRSALGERGVIVMKHNDTDDDAASASSLHSREESFESESSLPDPDDFPEDPSQDPTSLQATLDSLLPHDQLLDMIKHRKVFHEGWREGPIAFLPTYKYDVGTVGLYDSSEKQRAPSWCDRILYRTRKDKQDYETKIKEEEAARKRDEEMKSRGLDQDDDNVLFSYDPETDGDETPMPSEGVDSYIAYDEYDDNLPQDVETLDGFHDRISLDLYASHQHITSSDHKPVVSVFTLNYDAVVPELKALVHAEAARELDRAENEGRPVVTMVVEGATGSDEDENVVDFGEIAVLQRKSRSLTLANTGGVAATFSFVQKPGMEDENVPETNPDWLKTSFVRADEESPEPLGHSVTLDPGETAMVILDVQVCAKTRIQALNEGRSKIEDVLVLRIEDGRDYFIPVRGTWRPTCLGRSIDELIRVPEGGILKFVQDQKIEGAIPYDAEVHCSAPMELFKLTDTAQKFVERCVADETMLGEATMPRDAGWPIDAATWTLPQEERELHEVALVNALDSDHDLLAALPAELPTFQKLEVLSSVLIAFLDSLTDGLVPTHLWAKLSTSLPNISSLATTAWPDAKTHVLDLLSSAPNHNIAFVFLTATLQRMVAELSSLTDGTPPSALSRRLSFRRGGTGDETTRRRRLRERRYAEVVGPLVCRAPEGDKGAKERVRAAVEMFLRRDEDV